MITEIPVSAGSTTKVNEEQNHAAVNSLHRQALLHKPAAEDQSPCMVLNGEQVSCTEDLEIADECTLLKQVSLVKGGSGNGFERVKNSGTVNSLYTIPVNKTRNRQYPKLTVAGLWNIHRLRKQRVLRRFL